MKVPSPLTTAFGAEFESQIAQFAVSQGLLPSAAELQSRRFLSRSVVPHIVHMSETFNRLGDADLRSKSSGAGKAKANAEAVEALHRAGLDPYWKETSNPANFRLAYFLYYMPSNLYRVASVWGELARLGYRWPSQKLRAIELGAGPASGACGVAAGERFAPVGLPRAESGNWALIERDRAMLDLGARWAGEYFGELGWSTRTFHRSLDLSKPLLPAGAPKFNLWVMSYFLNESPLDAGQIAQSLVRAWEKHLDEEGVVIIVEPALRLQSRRLLELRQALIDTRKAWLQVLLPCLGHQACGALAQEGDWCHEDVTWWRPPYFRLIDDLAGLDRKSLPFSYLVITRSKRSRDDILPHLQSSKADLRYRLVSPAHAEGKEREFYVCGQDGKRRTRYRPTDPTGSDSEWGRGDLLLNAQIRGDIQASRLERYGSKL